MKYLLSLLTFCFLFTPSVQAKKLFVEMRFNKNTIELDDGSNKKSKPIKNEKGKELKFISLIGALNYMSLQGWELVETKPVISEAGNGGASSTKTEVYYIFSKDVSDEELEQIVNKSYKK